MAIRSFVTTGTHLRWVAVATALTLVAFTSIAVPAQATEYPSWGDVQNARTSESSKQAQISQLTALIAALNTQVAEAKALQAQRSSEFEAAQGAFDQANYRADQFQAQADGANQRADASKKQAGRLASSLSRSGGADLSLTLLLNSGKADELLSELATMGKLTERTDSVYTRAANERNSAQALTDQAAVAKSLLAGLSEKAQAALVEATAADAALQVKLAEQQDNATTMAAQLVVLQENRQATEADFAKGEAARAAAAAAGGGGG